MEPKTIVVVEDEPDVSTMLKEFLERRGYRVYTADNGRSGIATIQKVRPDLVVLDVMMPVTQGQEVCRFVKCRAELSHVRVVMLSTLSQGLESFGADAYLTKPVRLSDLEETVDRVLA